MKKNKPNVNLMMALSMCERMAAALRVVAKNKEAKYPEFALDEVATMCEQTEKAYEAWKKKNKIK